MKFLKFILTISLFTLSGSAGAQQQKLSNAAAYLLNEQLGVACESRGGWVDPSGFIESDFTGDGKADLLIDHRGFRCHGKPSASLQCGMQVCSTRIYVREGQLLHLKWEAHAMQPEIGGGRFPVIRLRGHGGTPGAIQWNGSSFVSADTSQTETVAAPSPEQVQAVQPVDTASLKQWLLAEVYLQKLGFDPGAPDGVADTSTLRAVEQFQRTYDLKVKGTLPPAHFELLEALVFAKTPATSQVQAPKAQPASAASINHDFADYPAVERLLSAPEYPDFNGRDADYRTYRTRIQNGVSNGVNFAGHYAFITIGCGTSCRFGYVVDLRSGVVFDFPYGGEEHYQMDLRMTADSRLIKVRWKGDWQSETCTEKDLIVEGTEWRVLAERTVPTVDDLCFFPFDQ